MCLWRKRRARGIVRGRGRSFLFKAANKPPLFIPSPPYLH
nr:MAG TPA: hypothetical protein [Caudoviricetes sp.]